MSINLCVRLALTAVILAVAASVYTDGLSSNGSSLIPGRELYRAKWSGDCSSVGFLSDVAGTSAHDIYVFDLKKKTRTLIATVQGEPHATALVLQSWDWSPDGAKMCYTSSSRKDATGARPASAQIREFSVSRPECSTVIAAHGFDPSYSPDGRFLAFRRSRGPTTTSLEEDVCVMDRKTGRIQCLHSRSAPTIFANCPLLWSPDSKSLSFHGAEIGKGWRGLCVWRRAGKGWKLTLSPVEVTPWDIRLGRPVWSNGSASLGFYRELSGRSIQLVRWDVQTGKTTTMWTLPVKPNVVRTFSVVPRSGVVWIIERMLQTRTDSEGGDSITLVEFDPRKHSFSSINRLSFDTDMSHPIVRWCKDGSKAFIVDNLAEVHLGGAVVVLDRKGQVIARILAPNQKRTADVPVFREL